MTIHEFGKENDKIMVLLHPAVVMWDIDYIRKVYPNTLFKKFENAGHASLAPFQPERFIEAIIYMCFVFLAIWKAADGAIDYEGYRKVIKNFMTKLYQRNTTRWKRSNQIYTSSTI